MQRQKMKTENKISQTAFFEVFEVLKIDKRHF